MYLNNISNVVCVYISLDRINNTEILSDNFTKYLHCKDKNKQRRSVGHKCQPPEYKNLEMSRNRCILRMSLKTMSKNNPQKSPKRHSERPGDLMKNLETPVKTGSVGRYGKMNIQKLI